MKIKKVGMLSVGTDEVISDLRAEALHFLIVVEPECLRTSSRDVRGVRRPAGYREGRSIRWSVSYRVTDAAAGSGFAHLPIPAGDYHY
jgi:hypothetical protein